MNRSSDDGINTTDLLLFAARVRRWIKPFLDLFGDLEHHSDPPLAEFCKVIGVGDFHSFIDDLPNGFLGLRGAFLALLSI